MNKNKFPAKFSVTGRIATGVIVKEDGDGFHVQWDSFPGVIYIYPLDSIRFWSLL